MGEPVRLVIADGRAAFADGLGMVLEAEDDLVVCGVAHDGCRVIELSAAQRPAVLLLDIPLPGDPATTPTAVKAASPTTKVLLLLSAQSPEARPRRRSWPARTAWWPRRGPASSWRVPSAG